MAPDEGSSDEGDDLSENETGGDAPDAPTQVRGRPDPVVESMWLRRRRPSRRGVPRVSTIVLLVAFCAVLALYIVLQ
ncbi:hypothetical protein ACL02S_09800 [Nocardia sp. 004]|uniref:hypothetical protein n=1 Tax=Nocardia sp. 004 TaxID=3385978 RepID=UPI0039A34C5B